MSDGKWYKKRWIWLLAVGGFLLLFFGIPLIINWCYTKVKHFPTDWSGGDALQFYGTVLSFIGTVMLSILALRQNNKANDISERMLKIEETKEKPYLSLCGLNNEGQKIDNYRYIIFFVEKFGTTFLNRDCRVENISNKLNSRTCYTDGFIHYNYDVFDMFDVWIRNVGNGTAIKCVIEVDDTSSFEFDICNNEYLHLIIHFQNDTVPGFTCNIKYENLRNELFIRNISFLRNKDGGFDITDEMRETKND